MPASAAFGLFGCGLLALAAILTVLRVQRFSGHRTRIAVTLLAALALFVPFAGLPAAAYVRGITGDPSITTLLLAASACSVRLTGRMTIGERDRRALLWVLVGAGSLLYPFALGLTPFDPYALGYGSIAFVTVLLLGALAAWYAGLNLIVVVVIVAVLAYLAGAYESRNLWDYLVDPLVWAYALTRLAGTLLKRPRAYVSGPA